MPDVPETLAALPRRYCADDDAPRDVPRVSLDDPLRVSDDATEEEIGCFRVAEGAAVTIGSDGMWLLFEP